MKYSLRPCLYREYGKERAVSLRESGSEHISWRKWRFSLCNYYAKCFCAQHNKAQDAIMGKGKKTKQASLLVPLHHLLRPCRELTAVRAGKVVECTFPSPASNRMVTSAAPAHLTEPFLPTPWPRSPDLGDLFFPSQMPFRVASRSCWPHRLLQLRSLGMVVTDSPEASFSCGPLDPQKDDFQNLVCLIMSPWGVYCTPPKTEARRNSIHPLGPAQGLPGGTALSSTPSARAESSADLRFEPSTGVPGPSPWKTVIPSRSLRVL